MRYSMLALRQRTNRAGIKCRAVIRSTPWYSGDFQGSHFRALHCFRHWSMIASAGKQCEKSAFSTAPDSAPAFAPLPAFPNTITPAVPEQDAVVDDLDCGQRVLVGSARRDSSNAL